jgi:lipoate-protein ligase A
VHAASRQCPLVRRQSGGGAIVHDRELTYSLAVPAAHPLAGDPDSLYRLVHDALVRTLADFGLRAERYEGRHGMPEEQAFLCFQRRAIGDVLVGDAKVCGSAQRRRRGAILQHGSLPGVCELSERPIDQADLRSAWREELTGQHGTTWEPGELVPAEIAAASLLFREKYTTDGWNHRR